jgi:hypothetical protein
MNPFLFYLLAERLISDPASGPAEFRSARPERDQLCAVNCILLARKDFA